MLSLSHPVLTRILSVSFCSTATQGPSSALPSRLCALRDLTSSAHDYTQAVNTSGNLISWVRRGWPWLSVALALTLALWSTALPLQAQEDAEPTSPDWSGPLLPDPVEAIFTPASGPWLVQTTVVPGATVMVAGTILKFSMLTAGPPVVSAGWAGLGGGRVASAAGGTGVDSPEAGETAAARVGAQPASGTTHTSKSAPSAVRQPSPRRTQIACVDIELTRPPARCVGG